MTKFNSVVFLAATASAKGVQKGDVPTLTEKSVPRATGVCKLKAGKHALDCGNGTMDHFVPKDVLRKYPGAKGVPKDEYLSEADKDQPSKWADVCRDYMERHFDEITPRLYDYIMLGENHECKYLKNKNPHDYIPFLCPLDKTYEMEAGNFVLTTPDYCPDGTYDWCNYHDGQEEIKGCKYTQFEPIRSKKTVIV